jgi:CRP-like cAMP-binding protein
MPAQGHQSNRLLAAMPPAVLALFSSDLKEKIFKQGVVMQEAGDPIEHVYFPQNGMISLLVVTQDGGGVEAATIGREGCVGIHGGLGSRIAFTRAVSQVTCKCSYLPADRFRKAAEKNGVIAGMIARYTELLWSESQQIAACNAKHHAEARLCRWLLQTRDRTESDALRRLRMPRGHRRGDVAETPRIQFIRGLSRKPIKGAPPAAFNLSVRDGSRRCDCPDSIFPLAISPFSMTLKEPSFPIWQRPGHTPVPLHSS